MRTAVMFFGRLVFCEVLHYQADKKVLVRVCTDPSSRFSPFSQFAGITVLANYDEVELVA